MRQAFLGRGVRRASEKAKYDRAQTLRSDLRVRRSCQGARVGLPRQSVYDRVVLRDHADKGHQAARGHFGEFSQILRVIPFVEEREGSGRDGDSNVAPI